MGQLLDIVTQSRSLEPSTRAVYQRCIRRFEETHPDPRSWNAFTVERWRDRLLGSVSPQTANKHLYALRYASRRLEALGLGHDFARAAEAAKVRKKEKRRALSPEELAGILATTNPGTPLDIRDRAILVIFAKCGPRVSGLCGLEWGHLRGNQAVITLKGGDRHVLTLDSECVFVLQAWQNELGRRSGPVFPAVHGSKAGGAMSRQSVHRMIQRRARLSGLRRPVYPHLLRHTFVSWALAAGVPAQRVMAVTGHKSLGTLSGYVTDLEAERDPVGEHLPSLLGRKKR